MSEAIADAARFVAPERAPAVPPSNASPRPMPLRSLDQSTAEDQSMGGLDRRRGLWAVKALGEPPLPLFAAQAQQSRLTALPLDGGGLGGEAVTSLLPIAEAAISPPHPSSPPSAGGEGLSGWERLQAKRARSRAAALLPQMPLGEHVVEDYATTGLTIKRHPLAFLRAELRRDGLVAARDLATLPVGRRLRIAGLVLIRQRPGSANGVVFITLEDETGIANLIVWPAILERFRRAALGATLLCCRGRLQREESVIHLVAEDLQDWTPRLNTLRDRTGDDPCSRRDSVTSPPSPSASACPATIRTTSSSTAATFR